MTELSKVPFGLRESDNTLVDIYDVPNGKKCACVCPSCGTPLEARQGEINTWHFSHSSKKVYDKVKKSCDYSFYLSLRLMAKQLIGKQLKLCLPEYKCTIEYTEGVIQPPQTKEFIVTEKQEITLTNLKVESTFLGISVDIIGNINAFNFIIYFTHPEREVPKALFNPENKKCGIIEISLCRLQALFKNAKAEEKTYQEILVDFLINDTNSKRWVFHPKFKSLSATEIESLKHKGTNFRCTQILQNTPYQVARKYKATYSGKPRYFGERKDNKMDDFVKKYQLNRNNQESTKLHDFICVICKSEWSGTDIGNVCPKCNTHLYSKRQ